MHLALDGNGPLYQQIYRALRASILARRLEPGARLPSTRALAADLGVSRNVVLLAFEQLLSEGYVAARTGSGTVVATALPEPSRHASSLSLSGNGGAAARRRAQPEPRLSRAAARSLEIARTLPPRWEVGPRFEYDFRFGRPAFGDFPHSVWCRLIGRRARRASRRDLDYGPPEGRIELREALADRLRRHRGVEADARDIVIVNGSQQALDLVARTLVDPGDRALIEEPSYPGARWVLQAAGAVLVPAPVDDAGIQLPDASRAAVRLAYVTPSHQFPSGAVMSLARRLELLEWAARGDTIVVEDDYDGEYRYGGRPLQALAGIDADERVVYVGTFSKPMFPALRLGYLVVPERLREAVVTAKAFADTGSAALEQLALADFITEGHFDRHVGRTRTRNAARRNALLEALQRHFGDSAEVAGAPAGLHVLVWVRGRNGRPIASATRKAAAAGVGLYSVAPYYLRPPARTGVLLGYAPLSEKQIREGVARLAGALL
jgi:GntR family transcriptional regulator/MocR family aminotransferase